MRARSLGSVKLCNWARFAAASSTMVCAARAQTTPCPIRLTGVESAPWRAAAHDLADVDFRSSDCANIVVHVAPHAARLSLTTEDGREAVRTLENPEQLRPTVEALLVADSFPSERTPEAARPPEQTASPVGFGSPETGEDSERPPPLVGAARGRAAFALQAGARGGGQFDNGVADSMMFSPVLLGSAWIGRPPWELGLLGTFEFQYFEARAEGSAKRKASSVSVGLAVGRRDPFGDLDVMTNLRLSFATLAHEAETGAGELRLGAAVGLGYLNRRTTRWRTDLGVDLVAGSHIDPPLSPQWALSALVGVELGGG